MRRLLLALPGQEELAKSLAAIADLEVIDGIWHRFPDGETQVQICSDVSKADVIVLCHLHHADDKILPLFLAVATLRDLGASTVGLVAPYLAYMRQDKRFRDGEGISARYFAALISQQFDWLITVDPHLHRIHTLTEVYSIPAVALTATDAIASWIKENVSKPLVIGPDAESEQWAKKVAKAAQCPYEVLSKERLGDREVRVSLPHVADYLDHTPVLVDDIISTGRTMIEAGEHLVEAGLPTPVCIAVHGVFAEGSLAEMTNAKMRVVTSNSIANICSQIDLAPLIKAGLDRLGA